MKDTNPANSTDLQETVNQLFEQSTDLQCTLIDDRVAVGENDHHQLINNQSLNNYMKISNETNSLNLYPSTTGGQCIDKLNRLNEICLDKTFDTRSANINQLNIDSHKNWINLNEKKMFLNRNLIYESTSNLTNGLPNQSNCQLNGQLMGGQLNGASVLNHNTLSNSLTKGNTLKSHLIQENKQHNNQIITGNAYSNFPFSVHETLITDHRPSELNNGYNHQQAQHQFNVLNGLESSHVTNGNMNGNCNYELINNQSYSHQLARVCPLTLQQRGTNLQNNLLNGHSLDALNTIGLGTATKEVFKKPINSTLAANSTINGHSNSSAALANTMSFTRHLLINSSGQTGSTGQLNTLTNSLNKNLINGLNGNLSKGHQMDNHSISNIHHLNDHSNGLSKDLNNGFNTICNSEIDVRRLCLSEQQQLEFNLVQELEQKSKLNQQNQINLDNEINHSTPKQMYGTLKRNKKQKEQDNGTLIRTPPDSKVRNICAKLFGSNSKSSNQQQKTIEKKNQSNQTNEQIANGHLDLNSSSNNRSVNSNQLTNGQPKSSSKLLASAVTQSNKKLNIGQQVYCEQTKENVIYAEIRKKQVNGETINQVDCLSNSLSNQSNISQANLIDKNSSSIIDDKYVVVVDSANSDHNTSNQSLTVKNSPSKSIQSNGILTTDLDQCNLTVKQQQENHLNNGINQQISLQMNVKTNHQINQQIGQQLNQSIGQTINHLNTKTKNIQTKQEKCNGKIGLESQTTSSSESGIIDAGSLTSNNASSSSSTLNGEQQGNRTNQRQNSKSNSESNFDQTSVTSDEMKRLKTFKEEVLENWNQNKKLIVSNLVNETASMNLSANSKVMKDEVDKNTFELVQLKIQKLLNDEDAFANDEDFDDLIASEAYQTYTQAMSNLSTDGKLDRLSVVNEFTNESDSSWMSDSTNKKKATNQCSSKQQQQQQSTQSNQQLDQSINSQTHHTNQQVNRPKSDKTYSIDSDDHVASNGQPSQCVNSLKRNTTTQLPQSSTITSNSNHQTNKETPQSPHLHHLHHSHLSPKISSKNSKSKSKPFSKLNQQQQTTKVNQQVTDLSALLTENSKRLNKLNGKNQYKNRSMDDLTDLMDDLNSVYTEATMNYTAPTVVKKQLKGIESMYSEILTLLNSRMDSVKAEIRPSLKRNKFGGSESSLNTEISYRKPLKPSYLRRTAFDDINSRKMKRLENHVLTLSKSVAVLTNEIRSNQNLNLEIQYLRKEVESLKNRVQFNLMIADDLNNNNKMQQHQQQTATGGTGTLPRKTTNPLNTGSNTLNGGKTHSLSLMSGLKRLFGDEQPQIRSFLKKLGYEKYASKFEAEKIGINELVYLTEENLKKLGMPMGPRIKLLQEIQLLNS